MHENNQYKGFHFEAAWPIIKRSARYFHITRETVCKNDFFKDHINKKECKILDKEKYNCITRYKQN